MENAELIKALKEDAEWAHANEWETPITLGDHLDAAADALEAADKRIAELEAAQRWIPVGEKLPEWLVECLCSVTVPERGGTYHTEYKVLHISELHTNEWNCTGMIVTHWMPLPQPPQKG
jgi:hypothetical protein